ncbi:hypothetical protein [Methylophaga sp.]|uniref:hypothetical protein n=1 Tax=Methylophaga sp. TaxID=2024840 RepID=UPI003F696DE2
MRQNSNTHILSILLVSLMLLQSVALKADIHQFHQTQNQINLTEHGLTEHDHQHMQASQVNDCQHCCHCHGGTHFYLISTTPALLTLQSIRVQHHSAVSVSSVSFLPAIRPPIV